MMADNVRWAAQEEAANSYLTFITFIFDRSAAMKLSE